MEGGGGEGVGIKWTIAITVYWMMGYWLLLFPSFPKRKIFLSLGFVQMVSMLLSSRLGLNNRRKMNLIEAYQYAYIISYNFLYIHKTTFCPSVTLPGIQYCKPTSFCDDFISRFTVDKLVHGKLFFKPRLRFCFFR